MLAPVYEVDCWLYVVLDDVGNVPAAVLDVYAGWGWAYAELDDDVGKVLVEDGGAGRDV